MPSAAPTSVSSLIGKFFSGTLFGGAGSAASTTGITALGTASTTAAGEVTAFGAAAAAATASLGATAGIGGGVGLLDNLPGVFSLGTLGFAKGGIVPSAQGGWALPSLGSGGILARLHSQEMVFAGQYQPNAARHGRAQRSRQFEHQHQYRRAWRADDLSAV